jgi:hypothetical protein
MPNLHAADSGPHVEHTRRRPGRGWHRFTNHPRQSPTVPIASARTWSTRKVNNWPLY